MFPGIYNPTDKSRPPAQFINRSRLDSATSKNCSKGASAARKNNNSTVTSDTQKHRNSPSANFVTNIKIGAAVGGAQESFKSNAHSSSAYNGRLSDNMASSSLEKLT